MAILTEDLVEMSSQTFDKEIDKDAELLIKNLVQKHQYSMPQKSTIRELACNALDAVNEKKIALEILSGKAKVEDYYIDRKDGLFKDSSFDPSYYDPQWLSPKNSVEIHYYDRGNLEHDELVVVDHGVGLWGKRLAGYFKLGYSTKRNAKFAVGKFGIGAKSALSTGIPYFTMTTSYNGKQTSFNVYDNKVEPVTPSFDMKTGVKHDSFKIGTEDHQIVAHYVPTTEKNGVAISIRVKKHHKPQYIEAVKSQLMYFSEVEFFVHDATGTIRIPTKAEILYEDDVMVIANNQLHNKPHLVIDKVNYGGINFQELELEEKRGNIGFKVTDAEVTVNPSRETVIWDDETKASVVNVFNRVIEVATQRVQAKLKVTDFITWIKICNDILSWSKQNNDLVLSVMAGLIDLRQVTPEFEGRKGLTWGFPIIEAGRFALVTASRGRRNGMETYELRRESILKYELFKQGRVIIRRTGVSDPRKNKYLAAVVYPQGFIEYVPGAHAPELSVEDLKWAIRSLPGSRSVQSTEAREEVKDILNFVWNEFSTTPEFIDYDSLAVPDSFQASTDENAVEILDTGRLSESAKARRDAEGRIILYALREASHSDRTVVDEKGNSITLKSDYARQQLEPVPSILDSWAVPEMYYGNMEDEEELHLAAALIRPQVLEKRWSKERAEAGAESYNVSHWRYVNSPSFQNELCRLFLTSRENNQFMQGVPHIRQFFMNVKDDVLDISPLLRKWNTGRLMYERLVNEMAPLQYFWLNAEVRKAMKYLHIYRDAYLTREYNPASFGRRGIKDLVKYLDNAWALQEQALLTPDDSALLESTANALLNPAPGLVIRNANVVDVKAYSLYQQLLDYIQPVKAILGDLDAFKTANRSVGKELEEEITSMLQHRGADVLLTFKYQP